MKEQKSSTNNVVIRSSVKIIVFVVAIIIFGISVSYAYYSANFKGNTEVPNSNAAVLNMATTLDNANAINAPKLSLIDGNSYLTKAEKVSFSVTNQNTSNVKAKYTVKLVEMSITKNLSSAYFKWVLVINAGKTNETIISGNFLDATNIAPEGTTVDKDNPDTVNGLTKELLTSDNAQILDIGVTDTVDFYIWLENDANVDQMYLTNGSFSAKLSLDAVPTK